MSQNNPLGNAMPCLFSATFGEATALQFKVTDAISRCKDVISAKYVEMHEDKLIFSADEYEVSIVVRVKHKKQNDGQRNTDQQNV